MAELADQEAQCCGLCASGFTGVYTSNVNTNDLEVSLNVSSSPVKQAK